MAVIQRGNRPKNKKKAEDEICLLFRSHVDREYNLILIHMSLKNVAPHMKIYIDIW